MEKAIKSMDATKQHAVMQELFQMDDLMLEKIKNKHGLIHEDDHKAAVEEL